MDTINKPLFEKETIFLSNKSNQEEVFKELAEQLFEKSLVTEDFLSNLLEREQNYPTGIDLSVINSELPNIAIPHTEGEFVKVRRIIPVKLKQPMKFHNMIQPDKELTVSFLFMILNDSPDEQANLLAEIMDFLNSTDSEKLNSFFDLTDTTAIYEFLENNFN